MELKFNNIKMMRRVRWDSSFFAYFIFRGQKMTDINWKTLLILACLKIPQVGSYNAKKFLLTVTDSKAVIANFNILKETLVRPIRRAIDQGTLTAEVWSKYVELSLQELEKAKLMDVEIINFEDQRYPQNLLTLHNYPVIIYAQGNLKLLNSPKSVAIIGTRTPSKLGLETDRYITEWFVKRDYVIISGLAKGCDTFAYQTALDNGGKTIAILAAGLDQPIYPRSNVELVRRILENDGLLISTYSLGTKLFPKFLVARDEWQSGLSNGVLVVETGLKGGTNWTIKFALEQQRMVGICDQVPAAGNLKYLQMNSKVSIFV